MCEAVRWRVHERLKEPRVTCVKSESVERCNVEKQSDVCACVCEVAVRKREKYSVIFCFLFQ